MTLQTLNKTVDDVQAIIDRSAFLSWLGLKVLSLGEDSIEVEASWRPEWVANPVVGQTQGGIHAALIDFAANLAMINKIGGPVLTIDLRVDYHRVAKKDNLIARGKVIKFGRTIGTSEAQIFDGEGRLIASGRGSFQTTQTSEAGAKSKEA
ncbi:uncharacterized protein (TIGR00369 family) [Mycoplana sp. BE70]|uniref:PaaI family thioesterase n=1 Tax=Mycoplana sp. BE70 TaxID=2817775 RepID=UPI002866DB0D|nr:PaaI family thioesterase [Mycoplana sp. BE70]MDR6758085.1 uncharacterized protein (TIGR00369 family) [Mycoplana sp. BE70]